MAEGDTGAVIETWSFDLTQGTVPKIIHVAGDVYVIVYRDVAGDGQLVTFEIDSTGDIILPSIERFEFDTDNCHYPDIIHISGDIFAIAYCGLNNDGYLKTVRISAAGDISDPVEDTLIFDASWIVACSIVHIHGSMYAIAYEGSLTTGKVVTVSIASDGNIAASITDTLTFEATTCAEPDIIHVYGTIYAIVFRGVDNDGFIVTVNIADDGTIGGAVEDSLEFDTNACTSPVIIHINGDIYAIAYRGTDTDGFIVTVNISHAGALGGAVEDSFEFETTYCSAPSILYVSGYVYAIAYIGPDNDGFVVTLSISASGVISDPIISSLEFNTDECEGPSLAHIFGSIYCVAFATTGSIGELTTFDIETSLAGPPRHELLMGI